MRVVQGVGVAALSASVSWGGYFFFYELMKKRMRKDDSTKPLNAAQHLAAGFQAGGIMVFMTNPLWLIKIRMQLQRKAPDNQHLYKNGFGECVWNAIFWCCQTACCLSHDDVSCWLRQML